PKRRDPANIPLPGAFYALLKLCFPGRARRVRTASDAASPGESSELEAEEIPIVVQLHRLARAGRGAEACREAIRRLRGSGIAPAVTPFEVQGDAAARTAAALLSPLRHRDKTLLARLVDRPDQEPEPTSATNATNHGAVA